MEFNVDLYDEDGDIQSCLVSCNIRKVHDAYATGDSPAAFDIEDIRLLSHHEPFVDINGRANSIIIDEQAIELYNN